MGRVLNEGGRDGSEGLRLGLQDGPAPAFDLLRAVGQAAEEPPHLLADLGLGAEAGVGGHLLADPAPDGLIVSNLMHGLSVDKRNGQLLGRGCIDDEGDGISGRADAPLPVAGDAGTVGDQLLPPRRLPELLPG
jgi:hypothetical protein